MKGFLLIFIFLLIYSTAFSVNGKKKANQLPTYKYFKWELSGEIPVNSIPKKMYVMIELKSDFLFNGGGFRFQHEKARWDGQPIPSDKPTFIDMKDSIRVNMLQFDPLVNEYGIEVYCTFFDKDQNSDTTNFYLTNGQSRRIYYTDSQESYFTLVFSSKVE